MIALLTDALGGLSLGDVLGWCGERGIAGVELGVGGYSSAPHVDRATLVADAGQRSALLEQMESTGIRLVALNASGNPLHPDLAVANEHDAALREAIVLAGELAVTRVVAMSGCPGGPGAPGGWPVFAGGAWLPDMEGLWEFQWAEIIQPYWEELSNWTTDRSPNVKICLELHPGTSIYNAASFNELRAATGENVMVNLDPSHFWWQGIDPIGTIDAIGGEAIGFVHGKDTILYPERIALSGLLDYRWPADTDTMPWHFGAVGTGRPVSEWALLLERLVDVGYSGPVSIEHEDPRLEPAAGVEASLAGLVAAGMAVA